MADQRLVSYIKSSMDRDIPLDRIRSDLYKAGWSKKDIEEAIAYASAKPVAAGPQDAGKSKKAKRPSSRKLYAAAAIIIIATIGITAYYMLSIWPPPLPRCGDGRCNGEETFETCPGDCNPPLGNQSGANISLEPSVRNAGKWGNLTFDIAISSVSGLYGFQFDLEYDPNILRFAEAKEGAFLSRNKTDNLFCVEPKVSSGAKNHVTVACTRLGAIGGVSGSGVLESITFTSINTGSSELKFANVKLVDSNVKEMNATAVSGLAVIA